MVIRVGRVVNVRCTDKDFKDVVLSVAISHILRGVTHRGFHESGKELDSVDYIKIGITNDDYNHNHIIRFEHPDTDYKWAYLYQIIP